MLMQSARPLGELENSTEFIPRHIGVSEADERHMLSVIGEDSRRIRRDHGLLTSLRQANES